MDSFAFRSFVKTAMALRAGDDSPPDYLATRAAIEAKFPKLASTERMMESHHKELASIKRWDRATKGLVAGGAVLGAAGLYKHHRNKNRTKTASGSRIGNLAEIGFLGTLGAPAAYHLGTGGKKEMSETKKSIAEGIGLTGLATPYAHNLAMRRPGYQRFAARVAKRIPQALKNG